MEGNPPKNKDKLIGEGVFEKHVRETIINNIAATGRAVKYPPGTKVFARNKDNKEVLVEIKKGRAGIYLAHYVAEDGTIEPILVGEDKIITPN